MFRKAHISRVDVKQEQLVITLMPYQKSGRRPTKNGEILYVPWHKTPSKQRRKILQPSTTETQRTRPIRSETRAVLIKSIASGRQWLDELLTDPNVTTERIAAREKCSVRKINMTISLAFLAPDLVKGAIEGRLPRGIGIARLCDLPSEWSKQYRALGLKSA